MQSEDWLARAAKVLEEFPAIVAAHACGITGARLFHDAAARRPRERAAVACSSSGSSRSCRASSRSPPRGRGVASALRRCGWRNGQRDHADHHHANAYPQSLLRQSPAPTALLVHTCQRVCPVHRIESGTGASCVRSNAGSSNAASSSLNAVETAGRVRRRRSRSSRRGVLRARSARPRAAPSRARHTCAAEARKEMPARRRERKAIPGSARRNRLALRVLNAGPGSRARAGLQRLAAGSMLRTSCAAFAEEAHIPCASRNSPE